MEYLIYILISIFGVGLVIASIVAYTLSHYSEIKLFISDIAKVFGWAGRGIRKISVSSELEGTINGAINDFNKNFEQPILPNCKIQWVTGENHKNILRENEAIVCISFDKKDHNLNFYNATYNFVQTALVAKAKPFLRKATSTALDLISTKLILKQYRREVLRTFNQKFSEVGQDTKEIFYRLEETDSGGLFSRLFLPELHYLGEVLNEKTPHPVIEAETENFLQWFYDVATRGFNEQTNLRFESTHLRVGVVLVAKPETYEKAGIEAYTKWAEKYAAENYNAVYILSKGLHKNKIAKEVAQVLIESKGFEQVNKNIIIKRNAPDGSMIIITTICLRPNLTTIIFNAWEDLKCRFQSKQPVIGIVDTVTKEGLIVNVSGIKVTIPNKNLSGANIPDASKLFREDQELELNVNSLEQDRNVIELSNIGTKTDPKKFIDANLSNEKPIQGKIFKIQKDKDGLDKGLMVHCDKPVMDVFIPRSKSTFSRFTDLSKKFKPGDYIQLILQTFNFEFGDYTGVIYGLQNPYETDTYKNLKLGDEIEATIKEIQERFFTCEIIEGLECRLYANEISWDEIKCDTNNFSIGEKLKVKVRSIDRDKKFINVSLRLFVQNPKDLFFKEYTCKIFEGIITEINDNLGLHFKNDKLNITGLVHWSEVAWGTIYPLSKSFSVGQAITITPFEFDKQHNSIRYSMKRTIAHQFADFKASFNFKDYVSGKVIKHYTDIAIVEINYNGITVHGYIHKSKVSNCCRLNEGDIQFFLPVGTVFTFLVNIFKDNFEIIELNRRTYLNQVRKVVLGETYKVMYTKTFGQKAFFYSDSLEGHVITNSNKLRPGCEIEVLPTSTQSDEFALVN